MEGSRWRKKEQADRETRMEERVFDSKLNRREWKEPEKRDAWLLISIPSCPYYNRQQSVIVRFNRIVRGYGVRGIVSETLKVSEFFSSDELHGEIARTPTWRKPSSSASASTRT